MALSSIIDFLGNLLSYLTPRQSKTSASSVQLKALDEIGKGHTVIDMVNSSPSQENVTDNTCEKYNMPTGNAGREASQQTEVLADQTDHYSHSKNHAACVQNKISGDDMAYKMQALESKMTTMCKLFVDEKEHRPVDTNDNYITKSMAMGSSSLNARQTMTEILEEVRDQFREHSNTLTAMDLEAMIGKLEVTGYGKNMENFELLRGVMKDDTKSIHDRIAQAEKIVVQEIQMKQVNVTAQDHAMIQIGDCNEINLTKPEMPTSHVCETLSGGSEDDVDQSHERASHQNDAALKIIELAIEIGDSELLKRLPEKIEIKVWLNKPDNNGMCAIHHAAKLGNEEIISILIDLGSWINKKSIQGSTPLQLAICENHLKAVKLMCKMGGNINETTHGFTLLHLAAWKGHLPMVMFVQEKIDRDIVQKSNCTPLHFAAKAGHVQVCKYLIECGYEVNAECKLECLLTTYIGVDSCKILSRSIPLLSAVESKSTDAIKLLIDYGADINHQDTDNVSPLQTAVEMDDIDIVKLLLEHGADSNLKNPVTGLLPLDCAISSSMSEVLERQPKEKYRSSMIFRKELIIAIDNT